MFSENDGNAGLEIVLILRANETYTKTLTGSGTNQALGGTHSGRWTSRGTIVSLSGDGNRPPYDHNLSTFQPTTMNASLCERLAIRDRS
jgi:hypothetical protein